ncbi:MAG: hypothetical protein CMB99_12580 [Flavobacteriaceae bacterium]|nr:hypothetical protein [Flavobacteriaceae bacterium]|tara:strand:- start:18912 stop:20492 length:1581 start_codon:yes stop_codon:yes gene_type:complete
MKTPYILIFLFIGILGCTKILDKDSDKKTTDPLLEGLQDVPTSQKVVITGSTDDSKMFRFFDLFNEGYLSNYTSPNVTKKISKDSIFVVVDSLTQPLLTWVQVPIKKTESSKGRIFLIPGDSIHIEIRNEKMKFFGKNAVFNNFYSEFYEHTSLYQRHPYRGDLMAYKEVADSIYNKKTSFLDNYLKTHQIKSKTFERIVRADLRHEYLHNLIAPVTVKADHVEGLYFNDSDVLYELIYKEQQANPEVIFDLQDYFERVTSEEFNELEIFQNSAFVKMNLNQYIRYYFLDANFVPYSTEKFLAEKKFIEANFQDEIKRKAILRMIIDFHSFGFGKSETTVELLKTTIEEYENSYKYQQSKNTLEAIKEDLNRFKFDLKAYTLKSKLVNIEGDTLSIGGLIKKSGDNIKVMNFWASWCPPCIKQIKNGRDFKTKLETQKQVNWIYISPEDNYQKWLEANVKYSTTLNKNNSYYLLKGRKSAISKFFKVNAIPRYVILDGNNKIVLNNAPSPADEENFEEIIDQIGRE